MGLFRYIGLACKMVDKTFVRNFRANNFDTRLLKRVAKQTDEVGFLLSRLIEIVVDLSIFIFLGHLLCPGIYDCPTPPGGFYCPNIVGNTHQWNSGYVGPHA